MAPAILFVILRLQNASKGIVSASPALNHVPVDAAPQVHVANSSKVEWSQVAFVCRVLRISAAAASFAPTPRCAALVAAVPRKVAALVVPVAICKAKFVVVEIAVHKNNVVKEVSAAA